MTRVDLPPLVGVLACVVLLAVVVVPYLSLPVSAVARYYEFSPVGPLVIAIFALVALVAFASGMRGRADPQFVAGTTLVLGFFVAILSLIWAVSVPRSFVLGLSSHSIIQYHRWIVVAAALLVLTGGGWYSRLVTASPSAT